MKTTSVAAILAAVIASGSTQAADMSRPAPMPMPYVMSAYNWSGFYIGPNLGGAWSSNTLTDNFAGLSVTGSDAGVMGGGQMGYNWQLSPLFVVGIEGVFDWTSLKWTTNMAAATIGGVPTVIQGNTTANWISTLAARFGYASNNWLFYGKAGAGWVNNSVSLNNLRTANTTDGWLVGAGIEYGLTPNWTMKLEYNYLGLSHWTAASPLVPGDTVNVARQINMFMAGVNYKF
jgi:outer membrane immunogenic protein